MLWRQTMNNQRPWIATISCYREGGCNTPVSCQADVECGYRRQFGSNTNQSSISSILAADDEAIARVARIFAQALAEETDRLFQVPMESISSNPNQSAQERTDAALGTISPECQALHAIRHEAWRVIANKGWGSAGRVLTAQIIYDICVGVVGQHPSDRSTLRRST